MKLENILTEYGVPDPTIVGKLPRGGITLDFVGHAEITRILIDIDPMWSWQPCAWTDGRPTITETNGMATMWGNLTVLGKTMLGVGSVRADKPDLDKELIGDFLRNASMRFGICLSLWSKSEWEEHTPPTQPKSSGFVSKENVERFKQACVDANLDPQQIADQAGVKLDALTDTDMVKLRDVFKKTNLTKPEKKTDTKPVTPKNTVAQLKALMFAKGFVTPAAKLELAADHCKRPIKDVAELTKEEMAELMSILEVCPDKK